jgi:hypothetical protein
MAPSKDQGAKVIRVEHGRGTGDRVYVTEDGAHISEPLGTCRGEVIAGECGEMRIRVKA